MKLTRMAKEEECNSIGKSGPLRTKKKYGCSGCSDQLQIDNKLPYHASNRVKARAKHVSCTSHSGKEMLQNELDNCNSSFQLALVENVRDVVQLVSDTFLRVLEFPKK